MSNTNGKRVAFEGALLALVFHNTGLAGIGDPTGLVGSTAAGSLYIALYTAQVTQDNAPTALETTYTGYTRVAVSRAPASWTISGTPRRAVNVAAVVFPAFGSTGGTLTHFAVCSGSVAAVDDLLYHGPLLAQQPIVSGGVPSFTAGALVVEED